MGGNSAPSQTTQTTEPPAWQTPYIKNFLAEAQNWYNPAGAQQGPAQPSAYDGGHLWREQQMADQVAGGPRRSRFGGELLDSVAQPQQGYQPVGETRSREYTPGFETVAGFNPLQQQGQQMATDYAAGGSNLINQAQGATSFGLDPMSNPYLAAASQGMPQQRDFLSQTMGGGQPGIDYGFTPSMQSLNIPQGQTPSPNAAIEAMMSGQPNMDVYSPLYDQIAQSSQRGFMEEVMPAIRSEAQGAGQYGDPRHEMVTGLAGERMQENMLQSMERMTAQASQDALRQQATGAGLASSYGLGSDQLGLSTALGEAGLGSQYQNLMANMGMSGAALGEQQRSSMAGEGLGAAGLMGSQFSGMYGNAMDLMGKSMALSPSMYGMGMLPSETMMGIGGQQQAMQQQQMTDMANRWSAEQQGPLSDLSTFGQLVGGGQYGNVQSSPYYQPSTMQNMLAGGMMGAALPGMMGTAGAAGASPMLAGMGPMGWGLMGAGAMGLF